jgi:hypothetical protein
MAESNGSNADIARTAQGDGAASGAAIRTEGVDPSTANVVGGTATARAPEPLKIKEQGMKQEAIEREAAKNVDDVEEAIEAGARFIQGPNNVIQPGVMDSGKYVRSTSLDRAVARDEETRENTDTGRTRDSLGRDSLGRVPRNEPLSDELINTLSSAELAAVATDRGYRDVGAHTGAGTTREAFRRAQAGDETLETRRPVKKTD